MHCSASKVPLYEVKSQGIVHQGWAWLALAFSLALHVTDEALTDFLSVYNPAALAIRQKFGFLPLPTFTFKVWLSGLILGVILLVAVSPFAFRRAKWLTVLSYPLGILMLANGLLHLIGSVYLGRFMPGVYSSPLLIAASIYLLVAIRSGGIVTTQEPFRSRLPKNLRKWLYRGGHPNWLATILNRCWAVIHALGVAPNYLVTLEVQGRRSGRRISLPLVMVIIEGERYLVSMLGTEAGWVQNVKAAGGNVTLCHGHREEVHLEEVAADQRAPVLKAYLKRAPGARGHLPVDKDAPLSEFEQVAARFPVFRVIPRSSQRLK